MSKAAARISKKRGKELFSVETVNTPRGKRYAIVSHREIFGQDKRILRPSDPSIPTFFEYTPEGLEMAKRKAKQIREDANKNAHQTH